MKVAILGGGSWGSALAVHLARKGHEIKVWEFFKEIAEEMQQRRICKLLPEGVKLPKNIFFSSEMDGVVAGVDVVLVVVPSDKVSTTIEKATRHIESQPIVICSKGFADDLRLLSHVVSKKVEGEVYCLYGPTHAEEVCKGIFSGIVLAGKGRGRSEIVEMFETNLFKVDVTDDIIGVQIASSLKNILAVLIGVLDGAGYGDNTKAYILTKGLAEIQQVGVAWGAQPETFYGLAGMGDVIVTCNSGHSRNRFVGKELGRGKNLQEILDGMKMVAEGVTTAKMIPEIIEKFSVSIPILQGTYDILFEGKNVREFLEKL